MKAVSHLIVFLLGAGLTFAILRPGKEPVADQGPTSSASGGKRIQVSGADPALKRPIPNGARQAVADLASLNDASVPDRVIAIVNSHKTDPMQFLSELIALPDGTYIETSRKGALIYTLLESLAPADLEKIVKQAFDDPSFLSVQIQLSKGGGLTLLPLSFWAGQLGHMRPELEESLTNSICRDFPNASPEEMNGFIESIQSNTVRDTTLSRLVRNHSAVPSKLGQAVSWANSVSSEATRRALLGQLASRAQNPDAFAALSAAVDRLVDENDKHFLREALKYNVSHGNSTKPKGN
jgi:hypothetical protein